MFCCASLCDWSALKSFINLGGNIEVANQLTGKTLLMTVITYGGVEIARYLINECGVNIHAQDRVF
jgi:hypothetical protein